MHQATHKHAKLIQHNLYVMMIMTITGMSIAISISIAITFWTTDLGFLLLANFSSAIPHLSGCFCPWVIF